MTDLIISRHGNVRMAQRGVRETDLEVILAYGTDIGRNRIMLRRRDAAEAVRTLKRQIANIERLTDKVLVVADGQLVTAYHQSTPIRPKGGGLS